MLLRRHREGKAEEVGVVGEWTEAPWLGHAEERARSRKRRVWWRDRYGGDRM